MHKNNLNRRPDPPKEYRFKKGQSGNPNGRPKNLDFDLFEALSLFVELLTKVKKKDKSSREKLRRIKQIMSE